MARNVKEALMLERYVSADEAWIDENWQKENVEIANEKIGFKTK